MEDALKAIEKKLDELLELERVNARNIGTLYRRTTALAHMVEAVAEGREPRLPKTIRAEIDASLNPKYFSELATKDKSEFLRLYGQQVLEILQQQGVEAISRMGDFSPLKSERQTH